MNAGKVNFGLILIIIGVAAFAVNVDYMHWSVYLDLLDLWPVLLIVIGLQMVLKRLPVPQLAYLSSIVLLAVGFWVLYTNYEVYSAEYGGREMSVPLDELDKDIERLDVSFDLDNTELTVSSEKDFLVLCHNPNPVTRPDIDLTESGNALEIDIDEDKLVGFNFIDRYDDFISDWGIEINNSLPTGMSFDCDDCDLTLRLYDFQLDRLDLEASHSNINAKFGSRSSVVDVMLDVPRSMVHLRIPDSAGVRILDPDDFEDYYVGEIDFLKLGDDFVTANYDDAPVKINLDITGYARLLRLIYY